jgi:hypothetical protein
VFITGHKIVDGWEDHMPTSMQEVVGSVRVSERERAHKVRGRGGSLCSAQREAMMSWIPEVCIGTSR